MPSLLSTVKVSKYFANHRALHDVSIAVPEQSIFGLLGPNGAGKTTLIRIVNQITGPDEGEVFFNGERLAQHHIPQIGYLPEERGLYRKMKVGEQALYLAQLKGLSKHEAKARLKEWFTKFEIEEWWGRKVEELSKGMQQKVQFIVTVLHKPKLLILDEPFSGFDPINANLIKQEIMQLRDEGATVIFSTHNMGSVEEICDHISLINKGECILEGSVREVREAYRSRTYEIEFRGNMVGFTNALWTGFELLHKHEEDGTIKASIKMVGESNPNQLLQAILQHVEVLSLNEIVPSMNDIFISKVTEMGHEVPEEMEVSNE